MSLPNYLAKIKSSGMYRFTFDKSQIPPQAAETMRLVVGYSEKGPFNNPVYIDNKQDFINLFGNINKRLERKGVFFHRLALQALSAGPILALNLKPFNSEKDNESTKSTESTVPAYNYAEGTQNIFEAHSYQGQNSVKFSWTALDSAAAYAITSTDPNVEDVINITTENHTIEKLTPNKKYSFSFWYSATESEDIADYEEISTLSIEVYGDSPKINEIESVDYVSFNPNEFAIDNIKPSTLSVRKLHDTNRFWKIDADQLPSKIGEFAEYINIAATDVKEQSCSIFVRKCNSNDVKQYNVSVRDWYRSMQEEMPEYLEGHEDELISNFFAEVYVFRGEFTSALTSENGALSKYFDAEGALKTTYKNNFNEGADALAALASDPNSNFIGLYRGCLLPYFKDQMGNFVSLDLTFNADKDTHKMIMKLDDSKIDDMMAIDDNNEYPLQWLKTGWDADNKHESDINAALEPIYIKGYTYTTLGKKSTALEICEESLSVLNEKGIFEALTNHVDSEYHYIIDTFESILNTMKFKTIIAGVAKEKDNCLAIINAPSMAEVLKQFNDIKDFETGYKSYYILPSEANGASFCAYYTPLVFGEGAVKTVVPSSALVSNNFMEKWNSRQPYYIVAGPNYGVMDYEGLIGPDYNYSRNDLDVFEPLGINCMVYVPRKGTYINSNQTAKQTPVSALSKVHVRELVIFLQNEIENMLQNYQWELNTQTLRDTIKTKADTILEKIKNNGGVYNFLNVCDATNNTPEVIDNEMVILDTSIEPARGAGKMVQRLTIHRTGGISSLTN